MAGNSVSQKLDTGSVPGTGPVVGPSDYPGRAESGYATNGLKAVEVESPDDGHPSQFQVEIHSKYPDTLPAVGDM